MIPAGELDALRRRAEVHEGAPLVVDRRSRGLPAATVLAALFELESAGLAVEENGRYAVLSP